MHLTDSLHHWWYDINAPVFYLALLTDDRYSVLQTDVVEEHLQKYISNSDQTVALLRFIERIRIGRIHLLEEETKMV